MSSHLPESTAPGEPPKRDSPLSTSRRTSDQGPPTGDCEPPARGHVGRRGARPGGRALRRATAYRRARRDMGSALPRRPWWLAAAALLEAGSYARLRGPVPGHLRRPRLAARLARELPDHDGGRGRHTYLRRGGRGRHRAHGLGAVPLGNGAARARPRPDHVLRRALLGLHGGAGGLRRRIAKWPARRPRSVRGDRRAGGVRGRGHCGRARHRAAAPRPRRPCPAAPCRATPGCAAGRARSRGRGSRCRGGPRRHRHAPLRQPGSARRGGLVGLRHRGPVGVLSRVRRAAAGRGRS